MKRRHVALFLCIAWLLWLAVAAVVCLMLACAPITANTRHYAAERAEMRVAAVCGPSELKDI